MRIFYLFLDITKKAEAQLNVIKLRNSNTILYLGFFFYVLN